jgi:hypothetical protein
MDPIRVVRRPNGRWRRYAIGILLLVAAPFVSYEWIRHWDRVAPGQPATEPNSWIAAKSDSRMQAAAAFKPIMDVQIVADAQPRSSLFGMPVELARAGITGLAGDGGFWVAQVRTPAIFVALAPDASRPELHVGDAVALHGTVQRVPDEGAIRARWPELRKGALHQLQHQGVYVEATEVSVHGRF